MKRNLSLFVLLYLASIGLVNAQAQKPPEKPKMQFMGAYDGGQPGVSIYKLFDPTDDVVCYVLTPEIAGRKQDPAGNWIYEGNSAGSISCLKVKVLVVPVGNQAPGPAPAAATGSPKAPKAKFNQDGTVQSLRS
jgi:hypothetical protein